VSETPEYDIVSEVLRSLRLRAWIFKQGSYCGAWALDSTGIARATLHLIGRGQAWVHTKSEREPLPVRGGDLVMFPRGDWHQLSGMPRRQRGLHLPTTGGGPFTTVLCAMIEFDARGVNPIMQALPPAIVVRSEDQGTSAELHTLARMMLAEYEANGAGRAAVLDRLAEVMFILVLRHYMLRAPELAGFLAAVKDERIARALTLLHRTPGNDWRVDTLASEAGMSRTVFAERFASLLGQTPMQYLASWRMHVADDMLRDGRFSVAQIAAQVGYRTEGAFRRAFKRVRGVGTGDARRKSAGPIVDRHSRVSAAEELDARPPRSHCYPSRKS
jgi:AraC-like DNA-binding protein